MISERTRLRTYDDKMDVRNAVCADSSSRDGRMYVITTSNAAYVNARTSKKLDPRRFCTLPLDNPVHEKLASIEVRIVFIVIVVYSFPSTRDVVKPAVIACTLTRKEVDVSCFRRVFGEPATYLDPVFY